MARSTTDLDIDDVDEDDYDDDWEDELTAGGSDTMLDGLLSSKKIMDSKRVCCSHSEEHCSRSYCQCAFYKCILLYCALHSDQYAVLHSTYSWLAHTPG